MGAGFPTLIGLLLLGTVYFLPALLAWRARHPRRQAILLANALTGWTVIGWAVCLAIVLRRPR